MPMKQGYMATRKILGRRKYRKDSHNFSQKLKRLQIILLFRYETTGSYKDAPKLLLYL